jgi:hypothetical protein
MIDTLVCKHGWPTFDVDPCPDCLREIEREQSLVTAAVTLDPFLEIPAFLIRDPITGTVAVCQPEGPQTSVGDASVKLADGIPAFPKPGEPGYVTAMHGALTAGDIVDMAQVQQESILRNTAQTTKRLVKAGFVKNREGEYTSHKHWDQAKGRWI